jgi:hypothetical protein
MAAAVYTLGSLCLLAGLYFWQGDAYVTYAEGVYLFSSRMVLDGAVPYRDFVTAHPPLLVYSGAGLLAIWDSLEGVRVLLAGVCLATGATVFVAVRRLTESGLAAVIAGWAALVSPWALHDHAMLMPETFGALLVMAAALLAARERTAVAAGVVAGIAIGFKWPFILPGLFLVLVCPARWRYLAAFAGTFALGVVLSFALFGADRLYDQLVTAQQDVGWHDLREFGGLAAQAAWNLAPLVVLAAIGVFFARESRDPALVRTLAAVALASLILVLTITKTGTYVNTIVLAEPPLIALGAAGVVWLLRAPRRALVAVAGAAVALATVQVVSFVAAPTDPGLFVRPFSAPAHGWEADDAGVRATVAEARRCPPGVPYSGAPFYAFVAERPMSGDEPDQFLLEQTPVAAAAASKAAADTPRCP